jgi:DNA-binding IclR family transcriptional regulator
LTDQLGRTGAATGGKPKPTMIASVAKALSILDLFTVRVTELSVTEISVQLGISFPTAHHLVSTLVAKGYLQQNPANRRYRLGVRCLTIGIAARESISVVGLAQPVIEELAAQVNEHVNLAVVDEDAAIYVSQVLSARTIAMFMRLGTRIPMYCTGVGKAILAHLAPDRAEQVAAIGGYLPYTATTIRDWSELKRELATIRTVGYAVDREEREEGVICVAAPVFDHARQPCAAVSVSGPSTRMLPQLEQLGTAVHAAADLISSKLGYSRAHPN